jgi:hypothetical protein
VAAVFNVGSVEIFQEVRELFFFNVLRILSIYNVSTLIHVIRIVSVSMYSFYASKYIFFEKGSIDFARLSKGFKARERLRIPALSLQNIPELMCGNLLPKITQ